MKKLGAIITGALLAGAVSAQGTIELTSAQMDHVTAGNAAAAAAAAGLFASVGVLTIAGSNSTAVANTVDIPGFSAGAAAAGNATAVATFGGGNAAASISASAVNLTP